MRPTPKRLLALKAARQAVSDDPHGEAYRVLATLYQTLDEKQETVWTARDRMVQTAANMSQRFGAATSTVTL